MSTFSLLVKELAHRKRTSLLAVVVVSTIVALIVAAIQLSDAYQRATAKNVAALDDEIRKTMKELGFNIFVLPRELNLSSFFEQDFGQETMSEDLVHQLAAAKDVVTINHLRPALIRKVDWPEQNRQIILMGVKGVVPWSHRKNPKKPLAEAVPKGTVNLGSVLAKEIGAVQGQKVLMQGREFVVGEVYRARGNEDDITAWIELATAQEMVGLPKQINMIQALNCNCASIDALAEIEAEISGVLGNEVKVIELNTELVARAQARTKVAASGSTHLEVLRHTSRLGFVVLTGLGSLILAFITLRNTNERMSEVGMLRAIGVSRGQILRLFLGKSWLLGFTGGVAGLLLGYGVAKVVGAGIGDAGLVGELSFDPTLIAVVPLAAAVVTVLATWIPVETVAGKDPAAILREAS